jgi:hypothetical protein
MVTRLLSRGSDGSRTGVLLEPTMNPFGRHPETLEKNGS